MDHLIAIFCDMADFCKAFAPVYDRCLLHTGQRQRTRQTTLALREMLTLLVYFPWRHYRTFITLRSTCWLTCVPIFPTW